MKTAKNWAGTAVTNFLIHSSDVALSNHELRCCTTGLEKEGITSLKNSTELPLCDIIITQYC